MKKVISILTAMLLLCFPAYSQDESLTDSQTEQKAKEIEIYFDQGNCVTDSTYMSNRESIQESKKEKLPRNPLFAVKSNLAGLGVGVANIAAEIPFMKRYSGDVSFYYSPYTISNDWNIRLSIVQPEFRYWLFDQMEGHFVGVHAHIGLFNVATNQWSRYQNSSDKPLWGFGLSYGYAVRLSRAFNLDLYIGAGYASLRYDSFYNVTNGAQYDHTQRGYWGVTRAGVSLSYIINRK